MRRQTPYPDMEFAKAFVTSEPTALHPRAPNVSIQDLHLNLTDDDVGWYSISLHGLFSAYDMPLMTCAPEWWELV